MENDFLESAALAASRSRRNKPRYDSAAMTLPDNVQAMRDVAVKLATVPRRSCTRETGARALSRGSD